ncbi:hypothetical protein THAOC_09292 [Thalassiosira oceanica]|uniref:Deacetylase sirtuin-type domain-containing protein n=1 Tax=Thalassiosira oceanica TaxID=159749 RepID=K0T7X3_THAOC|nr:hypothetical protein THAOC_09292 [Thalassiosira oceanica]|mmetsp:Transcript_22960/g.52048  ORF Transcript_22960/g.52048 Transcript_22960/m.52048 type:complete len:206 (+) Transcript_22960:248-865(+)|eukprot:EJK69451.1 hypothetical protein THAOC_09292 [Thalassiosira oceanica]
MGRRRKSDHEDDGSQSSARSTGDGDEQEAVSTNEGPQEEEEDVGVDELAKGLGGVSLGPKLSVDQITAPKELRQVADMIKSGKFNKILILTGAGVSVSAGIPDFRTPGTGLYDNLQKYNLPFAEAVFDIGFYRKNPEPFVQLAGQLWPGIAHSPTLTHSFISLLERKKMLLRNYTQNIDCLDVIAGVSEDKMVEWYADVLIGQMS